MTTCSICSFDYDRPCRDHCPICGASRIKVFGKTIDVANGMELVRGFYNSPFLPLYAEQTIHIIGKLKLVKQENAQ